MCEMSDQESELDIQSKTWSKVEKNVKTIGFAEGAAKGRDFSLQEGFNLGYVDGFKVGESLGIAKGIESCKQKLQLKGVNFEYKCIEKLQSEVCVLCKTKAENNGAPLDLKVNSQQLQDIISKQQNLSDEIISTLISE